MSRITLTPASAYPSKNPRACGTRKGPFVFTAGQVAYDAQGNLVGIGDIRAQTRQALQNVADILREGGAGLGDVMKVTVFLKDNADREGMNEAYREFFGDDLPARTTVIAGLSRPEILLEIEAVAVLSG